MNKIALFSSKVYHYVTIHHSIYSCIKECFLSLFRQWANENSRDLLLISLCCSLDTSIWIIAKCYHFPCVGITWDVRR